MHQQTGYKKARIWDTPVSIPYSFPKVNKVYKNNEKIIQMGTDVSAEQNSGHNRLHHSALQSLS